jgi:predicted transcriptional regulator
MRTTIDLPDDLHALARQLAHDENRSMGEVIADLIRGGLRRSEATAVSTVRGLPQLSVGRPITAQDVRSLDDDE